MPACCAFAHLVIAARSSAYTPVPTYRFSLMNIKSMPLALAAILSLALTGCDHSEIDTVKAAAVPQDATHTYDTALSNRSSCEKDGWRSFKDDTNRTVVEYGCDLKDGAALLAAFRQQKINDTQRDFQGYLQGLDRTAGSIGKRNPELLERHLTDAQSQLAQLQGIGAPSRADSPEALRQATVTVTSRLVREVPFRAI